MKGFFAAVLLGLLLLAVPTQAHAQGFAIGIDGAFVLPQGDLADITGSQIGGLIRAEFSLLSMVSFTARLGYLYGMEQEQGLTQSSLDVIPILAGVKWCPLWPTPLYIAGELGVMSATYRLGGAEKDESWTGGTLGIGAKFSGIDVRGQFLVFDLNNLNETYGLMLNVGFDLTSLGL